MTFHGKPHDRHHYDAAHESPLVILIPLAFLAAGSILSGYPFKELFVGHGVEAFFRDSLKFGPNNHILDDMHHVPYGIALLPTVMMALGFLVAWHFYIRKPALPAELARQHEPLYRFLLNKWYFDELYDFIFVRPTLWLGRLLWKAATAGSSTASGRTACRRACSTSPATWCGCRPATSITTPSPC